MVYRVLLAALLVLILPSLASGQRLSARNGHWEVAVHTRYTGEHSDSGEGGSSIEIADDLGWGFGFTYNINRRFSLGGSFAWRSANYTARIIEDVTPANTIIYSSRMDTSNMSLVGNFNLLEGGLTPYASASGGWMLLDTNIYAGTSGGCWWDPWWGYVCSNFPTTYGISAFTGTVGVGVRWEPAESFLIRGGYEFGYSSEDVLQTANIVRLEIGLLL